MPVIRVDRVDDPRLEGYRVLGDERELTRRGEFVAEGRFVVVRLIETSPRELRSLLVNEAALTALAPQLARLSCPIYVCAPRFFERLTGHHFHRGCLALAARPARANALELAMGARLLVVLDRVADPDNVGSVFRSALAFGADAVWLGPGSADPLSRKSIRTSMAATLRVPFATADSADWTGALDRLRERGFELLALAPNPLNAELHEFVRTEATAPLALLVGSEGEGLSPDVEARATRRLRIAMRAGVDSLNLGVAAGIALHWLARVR
jgi:tRNA G18 (ribose-2'-O)-methylase SpoU